VEGVIDDPRIEEFLSVYLYGDGDGGDTRGIEDLFVPFFIGDGDGDFIIGFADNSRGDTIEKFLVVIFCGDVADDSLSGDAAGIEEILTDFLYGDNDAGDELALQGDFILGIVDGRL